MKRSLTILLTTCLVILISISSNSQTTWVKTYNIDYTPSTFRFDSAGVGPREMCVTPNGTVITLVQVNQNHDTWLMAIDTLGNVKWLNQIAIYGGIYHEDCYSLHPTSDNGCIFYKKHQGGDLEYIVFKINANGSTDWKKVFYPLLSPSLNTLVESVLPSYYNTFYLQFKDSLVELSRSGQFIRNRSPFSYLANIIALPDSDIIRVDSSKIHKENFNGVLRWSLSAPGFWISAVGNDFIYAQSPNQVMKLNTSTGDIIWTKSISPRSLSLTSDNGFITTYYDLITKYDSSGTMQWTKTISKLHSGFRGLVETPSKTYVGGGGWKTFDSYFFGGAGFSPIFMRLDSLGNGVIDSTDYFINGNANDNTQLSFGDDAVYIAAALNNSGPKRDSHLMNRSIGQDVFSTNWSGSFQSGINYKFSDLNGNGAIEISDLSLIANLPYPSYPQNVTSHWRKASHQLNNPTLKFVLEKDSINIRDTIKINVILGEPGFVIDSIYGLSFDFRLFGLNNYTGSSDINFSYSIKPNSLGDTSNNLIIYNHLFPNCNFNLTSIVLCRNDHVNAFVAGDTIITLFYILPPNTSIIYNPVRLRVYQYNAITKGGFPVALNVVCDSLTIIGSVGINDFEEKKIHIFPNPAKDEISLSFDSKNIVELIIYDQMGRKMLSLNDFENKYIINVKDFTEGIYFITAFYSNTVYRSKFLVIH